MLSNPSGGRQSSPHETPAVATLLRMVNAVNAADAKGYAELHAPDAVITIYGGERLEGRGAIERYETDLLRAYPSTRLALFAIWVSGSTAAVRYGVNSPGGTGRATGHEGLLFYRFNDNGEIAEEHRYLDAFTPMAQAGAFGGGPVRPIPALPCEPVIRSVYPAPAEANRALVASVIAAFDADDAPGLLACIADDVVIDELMLPEVFAGRAGARAWLQTWTHAASARTTEVQAMSDFGDVVVAKTTMRGKLIGPIGRLSATGKGFVIHRAAVVRLRAGRVTALTFFTNGKELALETGQWPLLAGN